MRGIIFAVPFAASLIIIVLFLILAGILLMRVFSLTKDTVVYFFEGFFSPPTPLEKALICYYHICANTDVGCRHPNVDKWCRHVEIYPLINYEEICSLPSALKVDGEQCRKAHFQFPLRINLSEPQEVRLKTLRDKRNIDSEIEIVNLMRPGSVIVYSRYKVASFVICPYVELVNSVNEVNRPPSYPSCPEGVCLESATLDKSSYEVAGINYYKDGIDVSVCTEGFFSSRYSFYEIGQSHEVKVEFESYRFMSGSDEILLRISVDAEKEEGDQLEDYNYILELKDYDKIRKLGISFWGAEKKYFSFRSCNYHPNNDCKDFETSFKTSRGHIRVKIKYINAGDFVKTLILNITYEKP